MRAYYLGSLCCLTATLAGSLLIAAPAEATPTASQACEGYKNSTVGGYALCLHKARAKYELGGEADATGYDAAVLLCGSRFSSQWAKAEAAAGPTVCPSEGDVTPVRDFMQVCEQNVVASLAGGTLPADVLTCNDDLAVCQADDAQCVSDLANSTSAVSACRSSDLLPCLSTLPGALKTGQTQCYDSAGTVVACASTGQDGQFQKGAARGFVDNGDGTITDSATSLVWEKLSNDASIHDQDNTYTWGEAFAVKVATLNSTNFAGHSDWRLPNLFELESLWNTGASAPATFTAFNSACPGGCTVLTCSCTASDAYATSSGRGSDPYSVDFADGGTQFLAESFHVRVRAVRGGV